MTSPRRSHTVGNGKGVVSWSLSAQIKRRNYAIVRGNRKEGSNLTLKGVESKIYSMDFFVGHLHPASTKDTLCQFLRDGGVEVVSAFILKSRVRGSVSARIRVRLADRKNLMDSPLWLQFVSIRPWIRRPRPSAVGWSR